MGGLLGYPALSALAYMVGCFIFMKGYFPTPRSITTGETDNSESVTFNEPSPKLVWMVIDALRADFTSEKGALPFLDKMREKGHMRSYVALAEPPTVTLPRVKALTTGAVPEFLDVLRNYDGRELVQDSLVRRLRRAGRRLVFYGDDTWLKLFPDAFLRHDGTHSFFVNDYTEVDDNVTRHLPGELARDDWDVLILHYLGLDHIGHLAGPTSPLIGHKLTEMSDVMERVYRGVSELSVTGPPPVLVVCGDHGMSEAGSHGGASAPETQVALHFISSVYSGQPQVKREQIPEEKNESKIPWTQKVQKMAKIPHGRDLRGPETQMALHFISALYSDRLQAGSGRQVRQLDLAATLAALLGVDVPAESVGRVLEDAVRPLGNHRLAAALINNGRQLLSLYRDMPHSNDADVEEALLAEAEQMLAAGKEPNTAAERAAAAAGGAVQRMQAKLLASATQHDRTAMVLGTLLLTLTVLVSCTAAGPVSAVCLCAALLGCVATLLLLCGLGPDGRLCAADGALPALLLVTAAALGVTHLCSAVGRLRRRRSDVIWPHMTSLDCVLCAGCGLHLLSLGASSFIEEEHQTWYFLSTSLWLLLLCTDLRRLRWERPAGSSASRARLSAALLLSSGLLRRWNQTGDKWLHLPDVGDWLTDSEHRPWLAAVWAIALLLLLTALLATRRSSGGRGGCGDGSRGWAPAGVLCLLLRGLADERLLGSARLPPSVGLWAARGVFVLVLSAALWPSVGSGEDRMARLRRCWLLLCALLVRPHNLPVWAGCAMQSEALLSWLDTRPYPSPITAALMTHWSGMAALFYMGNSNSLASVDISSGYVGVTGHSATVAVLLTASHTYAGPVLALLTALRHAARHRCFSEVLHVLVTLRGVVLLVYCCLSAAFLHHIFVWTVFSPKLLYEAAWTVVVTTVALVTSGIIRR